MKATFIRVTILSTLPSAGVGAILALQLFHLDLGVIALIGIILLIGIVKKNAIMMIDFALEAERDEGKPPEEAIYQACLLRFRPIMMTTMAALLGGLPLAMGRGTGSELRHPLGISIVGGLLVSQVLTLYTTPVVYIAFDRLAKRFSRSRIGNPIRQMPAHGDCEREISAPFIRRPVATSLLTIALLMAGALLPTIAAGGSVAASGISDDQVSREFAGREPGDDGFGGGYASGAAIRPHRRRDTDDFDQPTGLDERRVQFDLNREY